MPGHIRHHGVKVQAHHIISGEGMRQSELGNTIILFGYNINHLPNLAFIPSTLQGACYLGVQPHRGNHVHIAERSSDEDGEPEKYHEMVARRLQRLALPLKSECKKTQIFDDAKVVLLLNNLSHDILNDIQNDPWMAPLTRIATYFGPGGGGCGGVDNIPHYKGKPCPIGRNHRGPMMVDKKPWKGQRDENITLAFSKTKCNTSCCKVPPWPKITNI
jgi:hypothetical protein